MGAGKKLANFLNTLDLFLKNVEKLNTEIKKSYTRSKLEMTLA